MSFNALEQTYQKLANTDQLSKHNKEILDQFVNHCHSQDLSKATIRRHLSSANQLSEHINFQLDQATKQDLKDLVRKINTDKIRQQDGSEFGESNKINCREFIKKLYKDFLNEKEKIEWLKIKPNSHETKVDPDNLLKPEEILDIINAANGPRNKALLWTLWDTGSRIGGLVKTAYNKDKNLLKWQDVKFKDDYVKITIRDKSFSQRGVERTIPVKECMPSLRKLWENSGKDLSEPVFVKKSSGGYGSGPLTYDAAKRVIDRCSEKAGISKRKKVNPHAWRKARATYKASIGWNQAQLCQYFGWVQGSKEAAKYIRLAEKDLQKALAKEYDEEIDESFDEDLLKPIRCAECNELNSADWSYCRECQAELDPELRMHNQSGEDGTVDLNLSARIGAELAKNPDKTLNEIKKEVIQDGE